MYVNGKQEMLSKKISLLEYLQEKGYQPLYVAVEKNGCIIPRADYQTTFLEQTDTLEIVQFVGGG